MKKYICIHGHFYQPPRENAWLEAVETQDSANPYHDWNERITAECYAPNAHARLLDGAGRIDRIVSNYSKMSFNFGPTLLSWMKEKAPDIHQAIVLADQLSQKQFSGHGTAVAQCYNHMIMPLANRRDKVTQAQWGIRDFESRFGRKPEGMWLPETAADDESLDVLAECGIKFTILSPFQARQVRALEASDWQDVNGGRVDPSMPYLVKLAGGRSIAVYFYDANIAKAVAFEHLLANGQTFVDRLMSGFDDSRGRDQLVNVATDGESYGHHFTSGDMALAYAMSVIEKDSNVQLSNYAEFLEKHPPTHEAQIHQASAWSCSHGVGRWKEDCGCNSGGHAGWNQKWRGPLREALDWLRNKLAAVYEAKSKDYFTDCWAARDAYIKVILDRTDENVKSYFAQFAVRPLNEEEEMAALRLLELQRHALLMYTSCGWFFDELSGLETVQVIQYAARALQLASHFGEDFEPGFLDLMAKAESNLPDPHNGRDIYERYVKPAIMTREFVTSHFAISSLFNSYPEKLRIYSFSVQQEERQTFSVGRSKLAVGRVKITFEITRGSDTLTYAVFHTGEHVVNCAVREYRGPDGFAEMVQELRVPFERGDFPAVIRVMDHHFGPKHYTLEHMFKDEQRRILDQIVSVPRDEIFNTLRHITDHYAPLRRFMADIRARPLLALNEASAIVLNSELLHEVGKDTLDLERIRALVNECTASDVQMEVEDLSYAVKAHLDKDTDRFVAARQDMDALQRFVDGAELTHIVPPEINLWKPQNTYYDVMQEEWPKMKYCAEQGNGEAQAWLEKFRLLGAKLGFNPELTR